MPFDPARDLVPISAGANVILLVAVHIGVPARSLTDLARLAQAEPGKLLWGSGPVLPRYVFNAFLKRRGLDMLYVPYRDVATPQADLSEHVHEDEVSLPGLAPGRRCGLPTLLDRLWPGVLS
jgi:tripartite-type tricarboxylate transporter receptor subunit TctC